MIVLNFLNIGIFSVLSERRWKKIGEKTDPRDLCQKSK